MNSIPHSLRAEYGQLHGALPSPDSRSHETEITLLRGLVLEKSFTKLACFQPQDPAQVAQLCLELVVDHRDAVTSLLVNEQVSHEALQLLSQVPQNDKANMEALAEAVLNARPCLASSETVPPQLAPLCDKRRVDQQAYWSSKALKHASSKGGVASFVGPGRPFFYNENAKSTQNLNGKLSKWADKFYCRHLATAIGQAEDPKDFLKAISKKQVTHLKRRALETAYQAQTCESRQTSVQFSREKFGELLATLQATKPSERHSCAVEFPFTRIAHEGHVMRVFMERPTGQKPSEAPMKVSFYEPNVSGDMTHLKALPEELARLSIDDFDRRSVCEQFGVSVLTIDVGDPDLALALAGKFVKGDIASQTSSLATALATGNMHELTAAASKLVKLQQQEPFNWTRSQIEELSKGLYKALQEGHADTLKAFGKLLSSFKDKLAPADLRDLLLAKRSDGITGLYSAIKNGHADVIRAYAELVIAIQSDPATQLPKKLAQTLLNEIRNAHGLRILFWFNDSSYKRVVKADPSLYDVFKRAKASLKVGK